MITPATCKWESFVKGLVRLFLGSSSTEKILPYLFQQILSSYSQDIMFYIFIESSPTWGEELACRHEILVQGRWKLRQFAWS